MDFPEEEKSFLDILNESKKYIVLVLVFVVLISAGVIVYFIWPSQEKPLAPEEPIQEETMKDVLEKNSSASSNQELSLPKEILESIKAQSTKEIIPADALKNVTASSKEEIKP